MRGRKPNLKVIEGGAAKGRCPSPSSWLTEPAKSEWRRAAPQLHMRDLLTPDTMATLESYCVAVGLVRECEEIMGREGRLVSTEEGSKPHPVFKIQSAAMREARLLAAELGLTPHRRGKAPDGKGKSNDEWEGDLLA